MENVASWGWGGSQPPPALTVLKVDNKEQCKEPGCPASLAGPGPAHSRRRGEEGRPAAYRKPQQAEGRRKKLGAAWGTGLGAQKSPHCRRGPVIGWWDSINHKCASVVVFNCYNGPGWGGHPAHLPDEETEESESWSGVTQPLSGRIRTGEGICPPPLAPSTAEGERSGFWNWGGRGLKIVSVGGAVAFLPPRLRPSRCCPQV